MTKPCIYPLHPLDVESAVDNLISFGRQLDGKNAAGPKPAYFRNFRFFSREAPECIQLVSDRNMKFQMRCDVHGEIFPSNTRILFNTSNQLGGSTCKFCERAAGVGRGFITLGEIAKLMESHGDFDWTLDDSELSFDDFEATRSVKSNEILPLICKRNKWNDSEPCHTRTKHRVHNILTALRRRSGHLVCQGECDSRNKGKTGRLSRENLERRLATDRSGAWKLARPDSYRKISEEQWFTHINCGNEVRRIPSQILRYARADRTFQNSLADDCPYCSRSSVLSCVDQSVEHFRIWVEHITAGGARYTGHTFPSSMDSRLSFLCECGTAFKAKLSNFTRNEHNGCKKCAQEANSAKRAWVFADAKEVVERRGYSLLNDPESYTEPAVISEHDGSPSGYANILELTRALPIHAGGFGSAVLPPSAEPSPIAGVRGTRRLAAPPIYSVACAAEIAQASGGAGGAREAKRVKLAHPKRLYHVDDSAFSTLTPETCYWAGLLAADGAITKRGEVVLELQVRDEAVIQRLAQFLQYTGRCGYRTVKAVGGRGIYCSLRFKSRPICRDLQKYFGIGRRKSRILPSPQLADATLAMAYMVGLIEGDGHVRVTKRGLVVHFVSAAAECFEWFLARANAITGTNARARIVGKVDTPIYNLMYHDAAARKLLNCLRTAYQGNMTRKWSHGAAPRNTPPAGPP